MFPNVISFCFVYVLATGIAQSVVPGQALRQTATVPSVPSAVKVDG